MVTLYFVGLKDKAYMDGRIGNQTKFEWMPHHQQDSDSTFSEIILQNIEHPKILVVPLEFSEYKWLIDIEDSFQRTAAAVLELVYHFIWDQVKLFSQWVTMTISGTVREQFNWKPLVLEEVQTFHTFLHLNIQY